MTHTNPRAEKVKRSSKKDSSDRAPSAEERLNRMVTAQDEAGRRTRKLLHHEMMSKVYLHHLKGLFENHPEFKALRLAESSLLDDLADSVKPRDAIEELLVQQIMWSHARTAKLSIHTTHATDPESIDRLSAATERASNTFRKLMLSLSEYRRAQRPPSSVTSIAQANIATQQIVQNHGGTDVISKHDERTRIDSSPNRPMEATECRKISKSPSSMRAISKSAPRKRSGATV